MEVVQVKYDPTVQKKKKLSHKLVVINEEELIRQVEVRPILYDKSLKGYRKSALRDQCWKEISQSVNCTVNECRKRWRSLRDAFAKHYKQFDVTMSSKKKKWVFYDQMYFIASYLDCANSSIQESTNIPQLQDNSHESILINSENVEQFVGTEEDTETDYKDVSLDHQHHHSNSNIERVHINRNLSNHHHHEQQNDEHTSPVIDINDSNIIYYHQETPTTVDYDVPTTQTAITAVTATPVTTTTSANSDSKRKTTTSSVNSIDPLTTYRFNDYNVGISPTKVPSVVITDPDERFLLSCAPILKRLSNKKNALARLKIQQILFTIEFGDQQIN